MLEACLIELDEALRLAVAGHVSAGKSTLVNALVGRRVAETGKSETTTVNAWFTYGDSERVLFRLTDGGTVERPLPAPGEASVLPSGFDPDHSQAITYVVNAEFLRDLTVIDTPGLFSPNRDKSERAEALVAERTTRAAKMANALLYLTKEVPGAASDDAQLALFQSLFRGFGAKMPMNSILVLTMIDQKWDLAGDDPRMPFEIAASMVQRHGGELWRRVWTTEPVIGHLAELARTGGSLSRREVECIQVLARYPRRRRLLESDSAVVDAGVSPSEAHALVARLGSFGLFEALRSVDTGSSTGAEIVEDLYAAAGLDRILGVVETTFRERAEILRADSVLSAIERHSRLAEGDIPREAAARMRRRVESVRVADESEALNRIYALRLVGDQETIGLPLSKAAREELSRLFGPGEISHRLGMPDASVERMTEQAHKASRRWRARVQVPPVTPKLVTVAEQAYRAYDEIERALLARFAPGLTRA